MVHVSILVWRMLVLVGNILVLVWYISVLETAADEIFMIFDDARKNGGMVHISIGRVNVGVYRYMSILGYAFAYDIHITRRHSVGTGSR